MLWRRKSPLWKTSSSWNVSIVLAAGVRKDGVSQDIDKSVSHEEDKDNFDGTGASLSSNEATHIAQPVYADKSDTVQEKEVRLFRQGMKYRRMAADNSVSHKSDRNRLPQGAVIIAVENRNSYDQVSRIVEHNWEVTRYKMPDGRIYEGYFPSEGVPPSC